MLHRHSAAYPLMWFEGDHALKDVKAIFVHVLSVLAQRNALPLGESRFKVRQLQRSRPVLFVGCALDLEDLENLIDFRIAREERSPLRHLSHDAPYGPYIYRCRVLLLSEEDLRSAVPQRHNLVSVRLHWESESPCQAEICQFDDAIFVDEKILRLQVSVHNTVSVTESGRLQDLVGEALDLVRRKRAALGAHVLLKIVLAVLKDKVELVLRINNFLEFNDVRMLETLEQRDFSNGR